MHIANSQTAQRAGDLEDQAKDLAKQTTRDHLINMLKATMNAVPIIGGPLASLMSDYIPSQRAERIEKFAKDVVAEFERVADKLDAEYVRTDEYAYLFQKTFENVSRDYQQEKLTAYKNILVNGLRLDVAAAVQENYLSRVENLTSLHLQLLYALASPEARRIGDFSQIIRTILPDFPEDQFAPCARDLDAQGITDDFASQFNPQRRGFISVNVPTALTSFGRGFIAFIQDQE